jgi:hypothetical protein
VQHREEERKKRIAVEREKSLSLSADVKGGLSSTASLANTINKQNSNSNSSADTRKNTDRQVHEAYLVYAITTYNCTMHK